MTPNPILKVLSIFKIYEVKCLLIGGQACIIYGAVEFSRDSDFVIIADPENMDRLKNALKALNAAPIYFPEFQINYLLKGHACHFRCEEQEEEQPERQKDIEYWKPLRKELETLRHRKS